MKKKILNYLYWLLLVIIILIIDFNSKKFIINNFKLYESISLIPGLNITYIQNFGIAFSLLTNNNIQNYLPIINIIIICLLFITIIYIKNINKKINCIPYLLIISGALGNLYDRLFYGFIIDFIDIYINNLHLPIFNIADIIIFIGLILIII